MDEDVKKQFDLLNKRISKIERFLSGLSFSPYSVGEPPGQDGQDEFYDQAVKIVVQYDRASSSLLQRKLQIGFNRAARLLEQLEENGIVEEGYGSKPRKVLVSKENSQKSPK